METKAYKLGTHRTHSPEQTLKRLQPFVSKMGITRVANITGLDRVGIPVYTAFRPHSRSISVSQGKGSSLVAAKVSAIMESVETYHAEHISQALRFGSFDELKDTLRLIQLETVPRCDSSKLPDNQAIFWIKGQNLFDQQSLWLPFEVVSTDYTLPNHLGTGYFCANTNGLASGNTFKEASCHAITEVIERDAEALWFQQSPQAQAMTGVDPASVYDENCLWLMAQFKQADINIKIWDMTSDVGVPCYTCLVMGADDDWADPEFGAGSHPCKEVALARAISEAAQARATFIAGSRDDIGVIEYSSERRAKRRLQGLKLFKSHLPKQRFDQAVSYDFDHIEDDLSFCLQSLKSVEITQVVMVDLSQEKFGLSVVKAVIPGLEGAYGHEHNSYHAGARARAISSNPFVVPG